MIRFFVGLLLVASFYTAKAATSDANIESVNSKPSAKLSKNLSFEDLLIQGQYQFSDESVVTVEQDKILDSLLGVRKDFQDRVRQSATRY